MPELNDQQIAAKWAHDLLRSQNFVILDTETTGLGNTAQIVQIAVLNWDGGKLFDSLVLPTLDCPIEPEASRIHGIYQKDVDGEPFFDQLFIPLMRAIGSKDVVIYNAEFDLRLLKQSLKANGIQVAFPTSDRRQCRIFTNGGSIHCAMLQYSAWCGEWNSYHGNYRWQKLPGGDHSALGNCKATLDIIRKMAADWPPAPESAPESAPEPSLDEIPF